MVQTLLYSFLINGIECVSYILEESKITRAKKMLTIDNTVLNVPLSITDVLTPAVGMTVVISRGVNSATEDYIFRGTITDITSKNTIYTLTCVNNLQNFKNLYFTKSYDKNIDTQAGEGSAIASDIISAGGLTPSVVATGTSSNDLLIEKFISNRHSRLNRLQVLNRIYNYNCREDYNAETIVFEPEGNTVFETVLSVGTNVVNIPIFKEEITSMRNKIYVDGAFENDTRIDTFDGDGSTSTFTLTYTPEAVELKVGGVLQKLGIDGGSVTGYDYTVDRELRRITFESGSIPPAGTGNIVMTYVVKEPYTTVIESEESQTLYGKVQEESYSFNDLRTVEDSDNRAIGLLDKLAFASKGTELLTDEYLIKPGSRVVFTNPNKTENDGEYIVQKVVTKYPEPYDRVTIGDSSFNVTDLLNTVNERLKAVEGDKNAQNEILRQIKSLNSGVTVESRYFLKEKNDISAGTTLYWNSATNGTWNDFQWGDGTDTSYSIHTLLPGNNIFKEFVYDTEFYDSASSTGVTFDTTAYDGSTGQSITIAATTGVYVSELIAKGFSFSTVLLEIGSASVSSGVTYEVSFDGGTTYQAVTLGTTTTITSTDTTGVLLKITNTNASALVIKNTYNTNYRYDKPAIKLTLG